MASKRWSVAVTDLAGATRLHDLAVEADNWMSALRSCRSRIGEEGGVPPGASCAVSPDGIVTILDTVSRRRFVLTQRGPVPEDEPHVVATPSAPAPAQPILASAPPLAVAAAAVASAPDAVAPVAAEADPATSKRRKFQTVAFEPSQMAAVAKPVVAEPPRAQKFQTVAFDASNLKPPAASKPPDPQPKPRSIPPNPFAPTSASNAASASISHPPHAPIAIPPAANVPFTEEAGTGGKRRKFQTVAFDASTMGLQNQRPQAPAQVVGTPSPVVAPAQVAPAPIAPAPAVVKPAAVAPAAAPIAVVPIVAKPMQPQIAHNAGPKTPSAPQLLHERSEDPTPKNPLTYRERSFLVEGNTTRASAEAILRSELARIKEELSAAKRGKFVNLALFDHRWQDRPQRPPIAALQWKDWKGDPELTFPAPAAPAAQPAAAASNPAHDDRLATAFEALQDLPFLKTAAEGLEFAVKLLSDTIASQAIAASLYDINTDELRIVAAAGPGANERKTTAIPVAIGLFGQAARGGDHALVIADVQSQPEFDPGLDSAPGIDARNMLLRPLVQDGQLFGVLQLTNRVGHNTYSTEDVNLINYIAERVAGFVRQSRLGGR